jgi:hypothetical protein
MLYVDMPCYTVARRIEAKVDPYGNAVRTCPTATHVRVALSATKEPQGGRRWKRSNRGVAGLFIELY